MYQLLLDSPTWWLSTYVMLDRAEQLKDICGCSVHICVKWTDSCNSQTVDQFVYEIGSQERDRERR